MLSVPSQLYELVHYFIVLGPSELSVLTDLKSVDRSILKIGDDVIMATPHSCARGSEPINIVVGPGEILMK